MKRVKAVMAIGVLLSGLLVAVWSSPAGAAARANFGLVSVRSGRCLDADLNTIGGNGTKVQLWDCNGQLQQRWTYYVDDTIRSSKSRKCLDADLNAIGSNGAKVQLWACNGSRQQKWTFISGSVNGSLRAISQYNGRCLDADLNTIRRNGTKMQLWDCNAQPQQDWRVRR
jgi:hypothetical protein